MTLPEISVGIDIIAIERVHSLLEDYPERFRDFVFTVREQSYCDQQARPSQHYAARWAVKESFIKTLGNRDDNPPFSSLEVIADPSPRLILEDEAEHVLNQSLNSDEFKIAVSMSHEYQSDLAFGMVLLLYKP